jgi:hypothetical protein
VVGALWGAIWFVMANPTLIGRRVLWFSDGLSFVATLYLPAIVVGADILGHVFALALDRLRSHWRPIGLGAAAAALSGLAAWGGWHMIDVIQPATVLATSADLAAIEWIRENLPTQAKILINAQPWADNTYVGSDGGYWIGVLARRQTTLPLLDYPFAGPDYVQAVNSLAERIANGPDWESAGWRVMLLRRGVTHVYSGALGGPIDPTSLARNPAYAVVYSNGPVWLFADRAALSALAQAQARGDNDELNLLPYRQYMPYLLSRKTSGAQK